MESLSRADLIAACGMNCGLCLAYLREKKHCPGCRAGDEGKSVSCLRCRIKNCETYRNSQKKYCFECDDFPCQRLKHLDKRYQTKYGMSEIENLKNIRKYGIKEFVKNEDIRWTCPACGGTICVHRGFCSRCGEKSRSCLKSLFLVD